MDPLGLRNITACDFTRAYSTLGNFTQGYLVPGNLGVIAWKLYHGFSILDNLVLSNLKLSNLIGGNSTLGNFALGKLTLGNPGAISK